MLETEAIVAIVSCVIWYLISRKKRTRQHDSILDGESYFLELLNTENVNRFQNAVRMDRTTFIKLLVLLKKHGGLKDGKKSNSCKICAGQKLMIFIHILTGASIRSTCERWQHSSSTISKTISEVSQCVLSCKDIFFVPVKPGDPVSPYIQNSYRYFPYFENCVGAFDGTHIPAVPPLDERFVFRNRKGVISQNVLAVADFDLTFTYALTGWEGSAHDGRVLNDSKTKGFPSVQGKFFLADAGYGLARDCLTPYRGVRYHLKEWALGNRKPQNKEELFNHRHSSLRNVIERIFGVLKKRFPLLVCMHSYPFTVQQDLVECAMIFHNFIRHQQRYDDQFYENLPEEQVHREEEAEANEMNNANPVINSLNEWRDGIAQRMWDDYQNYLLNR